MEIGSLTVKHQDFKAELERLLSRLGYPVASIAAAIPDETVPLWPEDFVFLEALPSLQRFKEQAKEALPLVIKSYSSGKEICLMLPQRSLIFYCSRDKIRRQNSHHFRTSILAKIDC